MRCYFETVVSEEHVANTIMMCLIFGDFVLFWEFLCQCDFFLHLEIGKSM